MKRTWESFSNREIMVSPSLLAADFSNLETEIKRIEGIIEQQKAFGRERNFITIESKRKMLEKKKVSLLYPKEILLRFILNFSLLPKRVTRCSMFCR